MSEKTIEKNRQEFVKKRFEFKNPLARVFATIIDILSVFILTTIVAASAGFPIANAVGLSESSHLLTIMLYQSGLYEFDDNDSLVQIDEASKFPKALYLFYVDVPLSEDADIVRGYSPLLDESKTYNDAEAYYTYILGKGSDETPFDFSMPIDGETPWIITVKSGHEDAAKSLYFTEMKTSFDILFANEDVIEMNNKANTMLYATVALSFLVSAFLLITVFPLLMRDGTTLGKLMTGTTLANKLGYKLSKPQAFLRGFMGFLIYYALFILPIGFVSLLMIALRKDQRSLVDMIAGTVSLDKKASVVYKDAAEEKYYHIRLAKELVKNRRRREQLQSEEDEANSFKK